MKVLILAGGLGTRLSEETSLRPKPMVEIGGRPMLWHIMKHYAHYGFSDFIILTGYKGHVIKDFFINYYTQYSDITIDLATNSLEIHATRHEPWRVTLLYTGQHTQTASRIYHAKPYIGDKPFLLTYGDGLSDINLHSLVSFHKKHGRAMTMSSIMPAGRFGALDIDSSSCQVRQFIEKPQGEALALDVGWINAGFFVCEARVLEYIARSAHMMDEGIHRDAKNNNNVGTAKDARDANAMASVTTSDTKSDANALASLHASSATAPNLTAPLSAPSVSASYIPSTSASSLHTTIREDIILEQAPLRALAHDGELYAYKHKGFWKCMDTLKDKHELAEMWASGNAPWAIWDGGSDSSSNLSHISKHV